jgi:hypothetical protein
MKQCLSSADIKSWSLNNEPQQTGTKYEYFICTAQLQLGGKAQGFELIIRRQIKTKGVYNKRLIITENSTALTVILHDHNNRFGLFLFTLTFLLESLLGTKTSSATIPCSEKSDVSHLTL